MCYGSFEEGQKIQLRLEGRERYQRLLPGGGCLRGLLEDEQELPRLELGKERAFQAEGTLRAKPARLETSWREVKGKWSKARALESRTMSFTGQERKGSSTASDSGTDVGQGALALPGSSSVALWEKDCFRLSHLISLFQTLCYPSQLSQIPFSRGLVCTAFMLHEKPAPGTSTLHRGIKRTEKAPRTPFPKLPSSTLGRYLWRKGFLDFKNGEMPHVLVPSQGKTTHIHIFKKVLRRPTEEKPV